MNASSELDVEASIRSWADERHLPDSHLKRWLAMSRSDRAEILSLAAALRLRTGQMVVLLELVADLTLSMHQTLAALLQRAELRRAINGKGSAPSRAVALIEALRAMRYPRLTETAERIATEIRGLKLPPGFTVIAPKNLASDEITIQIRLNRIGQIDPIIDALTHEKSGVARILAILHGED